MGVSGVGGLSRMGIINLSLTMFFKEVVIENSKVVFSIMKRTKLGGDGSSGSIGQNKDDEIILGRFSEPGDI